jgi:hypothetical protein
MNLTWIKQKVVGKAPKEAGVGPYMTFAEMDTDVVRVYQNATNYNKEGDAVYRMAADMFRIYQEDRKALARALKDEETREKALRKQERAVKRQQKQAAGPGAPTPPLA